MRQLNTTECCEVSGAKFDGVSLDPLRNFLGNHWLGLSIVAAAAALVYTYFIMQE